MKFTITIRSKSWNSFFITYINIFNAGSFRFSIFRHMRAQCKHFSMTFISLQFFVSDIVALYLCGETYIDYVYCLLHLCFMHNKQWYPIKCRSLSWERYPNKRVTTWILRTLVDTSAKYVKCNQKTVVTWYIIRFNQTKFHTRKWM